MSGSLEKACIKICNGKQEGTTVDCAFNPQEYRIDKSVEYQDHDSKLDVPLPQFAGGVADVLSTELFFDTTADESDVRSEYIDTLDSLLEVDGELHAPPRCRFLWGGGLDFKGVLVSADKRFTRFLADGTPVRAWVKISLKEYADISQQKSNIKHESTDKTKLWTVTEGDTLWRIAAAEYGDPSRWRTIANANGLEKPRGIESGTKLTLPPL